MLHIRCYQGLGGLLKCILIYLLIFYIYYIYYLLKNVIYVYMRLCNLITVRYFWIISISKRYKPRAEKGNINEMTFIKS